MASEKQIQSHIAGGVEQSSRKAHTSRRNLKIILGGVALLTTGFAAGMTMRMFCDNPVPSSPLELTPPATPTSPSSPIHMSLFERDPAQDGSGNSVKVLTNRPNKFFGPSKVEEETHTRNKQNNNIATRETPDLPQYLETRETLEKRGVWQPTPGLNWTYQLNMIPTPAQLLNPKQFQVWDIDLFDTPALSIKTIHLAGSKVICYFSAGTEEDWRTDALSFTTADKGKAMGDWPGETWINTNSANVRKIMAARLDLAKAKGCDGVDPDNMDAYNHDTGFGLQQSDAISYITFLSQEAAKRGLAIGLKNSGEIIPKVVDRIQYSVEEACSLYNECDIYKPLTDVGKPVFHVEYPKGYGVVNTKAVGTTKMNTICGCIPKWNFSPIVKNNNLDSWQQQCK